MRVFVVDRVTPGGYADATYGGDNVTIYDTTSNDRATAENNFDDVRVSATSSAATHALPVTPVSTPQAGSVNQEVMVHTTQGDFVIELFADTPVTTANFLNYVVSNRYDNSFFHRLVTGFVLQGGGYYYDGTNVTTVPTYAPITNEYSAAHPNALGTISMARTSDLNSATSQFFFNLVDNSANLTNYAVFGQVIQGWSTITTIANLPVVNAGSPFDTLPVQNYSGSGAVGPNNVVKATFDVLAIANDDQFTINHNGFLTGVLTGNDTDLDDNNHVVVAKINGQAASVYHIIGLPSGANLLVDGDGNVRYDPNHAFDYLATNQTATDSFTYSLANGSLNHGTATVTITITGLDGASPTIVGTSGDDTLGGSVGNDTFDGLSGNDAMRGLGGDDTYYVDSQGDLVYEFPNDGTDTVIASTGYYLYPYVENLILASHAGNIFGVGNAQDNSITGNEGANTLLGADGNDTIHGGGGIDIIYGQAGFDYLYGDAGNDFLAGGDDHDVIDGGAGGDSLYGEGGDDSLDGGKSFEFDILVGGDGNDVLHGDSGFGDYDYLYGNAGDDSFVVDTGDDLTFELPGEGIDTVYANTIGDNNGVYLYANIENLVLIGFTAFGVGNELDNHITGNAAGNPLLGGAGDDVIDGRDGNDILFGQAGADTFVFTRSSYRENIGSDAIGDFTPGEDKIDISNIGYNWAQLQGAMHEYNGSTAIDLLYGSSVVLNGVTIAQLHESDFILGGGLQNFAVDVPDDAPAPRAAAPAQGVEGFQVGGAYSALGLQAPDGALSGSAAFMVSETPWFDHRAGENTVMDMRWHDAITIPIDTATIVLA